MSASIILVHLGSKPFPTYGYDCIDQIRLFNADEAIYVIIGKECQGIDRSRLEAQHCILVFKEELRRTFKHGFYLATNLLRRRGLEGFWLYATERFFLIEEVMEKYNLRDVIHLENDVLLYFEIAKSLGTFVRLYPELGVIREHDDKCLASLLYVADADAISRFNNYVAYNIFSRMKTDMGLLASYTRNENKMQLPIVAPSYAEHFKLVNLSGEEPQDATRYSKNYEEFGMQFDGASFGQYIGGLDKIHTKKDTRGFINETAYVNPSNGRIVWEPDDGHRLRPYFKYGEIEVAIANLHIHSKELKIYRSDRDVAEGEFK